MSLGPGSQCGCLIEHCLIRFGLIIRMAKDGRYRYWTLEWQGRCQRSGRDTEGKEGTDGRKMRRRGRTPPRSRSDFIEVSLELADEHTAKHATALYVLWPLQEKSHSRLNRAA